MLSTLTLAIVVLAQSPEAKSTDATPKATAGAKASPKSASREATIQKTIEHRRQAGARKKMQRATRQRWQQSRR